MAVDTPARIAILGAGPIGVEATLYARYLGYDVDLYERGRAFENVLRWGHARLFTPFEMNRSTLGLAALKAQDESYRPPDDGELLTGREWVSRYLGPLAQSDLVADHLREQTTVLAVGRPWLIKGDLPGAEERGDEPFRLLVRSADGAERAESADVVIDATGVFGTPNWLGQGGVPAVGEVAARDHIEYGLPDVLGSERDHYAGKRVLVVGAGASAATTVVALAALARDSQGTSVVWVTRQPAMQQPGESNHAGPIMVRDDDPLPERKRLAQAANALAQAAAHSQGSDAGVRHLAGAAVDKVFYDPSKREFRVTLAFVDEGDASAEQTFDRIVANVGYRPDNRIYAELQIDECYASGGPMNRAASRGEQTSADGLNPAAAGPAALFNPEPNFYILGAKSYGRDSRFLYRDGLAQIRDLFTILGDREGLNLYESAKSLL